MRRIGVWRRFTVMVVKPTLWLMTRRHWRGMENIPATGGVILAANHYSHADPLTVANYVYDAGRWPQFLAKSSLFTVPVVGSLLRAVRQIPVYRGTVDAVKSLEAAVKAVKEGDAVIFYPEGTTTRQPDLWPMKGKTGVARLALATGAPVIPVAHWGTQVFYNPITRAKSLKPRRPVAVVAGPPVDLSRWRGAEPTTAVLNEMTDEIMYRIRDLLTEIRTGPAPAGLYQPTRATSTGKATKDPGRHSPGTGKTTGDPARAARKNTDDAPAEG